MKSLVRCALGALLYSTVALAASWSFEDASISVSGKAAGVGGASKEKLSPNSPLTSPLALPAADSLKVILTTTEGSTGKRAHQAFLTLHEPTTGLEESFPFSVKENGKGKVEVTQKDLPFQFLTSTQPLKASLVIASFGSSTPYNQHAFDLSIETDAAAAPAVPSPPERYTSQPEIRHMFKADPRSPPAVISLVFTLAVLAALPALLGAWLLLGANLDHIGKAFNASPVAHGLFFGSIIAMEGVFFLYYTVWNLFQALPAVLAVGVVGYVSGSRALTEVQDRRLAGER
ncbi:hypothetical protein BAUCODRAFT_35956 [Baudoinia panamericana UAMH 10762]|uniref:Ribophorin II C-terminal domain-containing protein n=1 Tax=Baudoinia panamericana (strain UAMH 10762) TaxID=717646 RepID=M2MDT1_BAUPA|nr:uncharacterized protein BAUCODRAFT_35956 [Baudoinia panamericana UAMH 10762]EMC94716.1 hypothetical protein BAUCODRAFT_35956 [Baudoinia panamericana UAMH 10762]